jgi:ribosomal protein L37AE/L43A
MTSKQTTVSCPGCGRNQPRQRDDTIYWCGVCQCQFDGDPGDGGDYFNDPTKRIEVQEQRTLRRSARQKR